MSPRKYTQSVEHKYMGTFHWKHFTEKGNWHPGVSSTAPRLEFMQSEGSIKEFVDDRKGTKFNVIFDAEYVFEYLYQKIIINMGWESDGRIDNEVLGYFLKDFAEYCSAVEQRKQSVKLKEQAKELSETFPSKTASEWEEILLQQLQDTAQNTASEKVEASSTSMHDEDGTEKEMTSMDDNNATPYTDIDFEIKGDEEDILVAENEALGNETERTEAVVNANENKKNAILSAVSSEMEETIDVEIEATKNTTEEDVTPIVPIVEPKKRGRPKKS